MIFLQLAGLAFFTTLAVTGFMVAAGLGDVADHRSAHRDTVPTGGGIGFVAGLGAAVIAFSLMGFSDTLQKSFAPVLSLIFAVAMLGIIDDIVVLSARVKFGSLLILCAAAVYVIGPVTHFPLGLNMLAIPFLIGFLGSVLWVFVATNAVNFMDGANGFMGTVMAVANLGLFCLSIYSGAPETAILSLLCFAILLGFLPYNYRRKAVIFSGDVGALFIGFAFAVAVLMLVNQVGAMRMIYAGPLLILPFLTDVFLTLIRRVRRKENLLEAHNMHLYQRLIRAGWSQTKVTWLYGFIGLTIGNVVWVCTRLWDVDLLMVLSIFTAICIAGYYDLSRRLPD